MTANYLELNNLVEKLEKLLVMAKAEGEIRDNYIGNSEVSSQDYRDYSQEVEGDANMLLIAKDGQCNWEAHRILKGMGYTVTCGEKDSFGWLTGIIIFPTGEKFVYC